MSKWPVPKHRMLLSSRMVTKATRGLPFKHLRACQAASMGPFTVILDGLAGSTVGCAFHLRRRLCSCCRVTAGIFSLAPWMSLTGLSPIMQMHSGGAVFVMEATRAPCMNLQFHALAQTSLVHVKICARGQREQAGV